MGRPIKRNFFKNPGNAPVPGDSISSVNITNRGLGYFSANVAMTLSAPDLAEGTQATVSSVSLFSNGAIRSATIDNAGAGYVNAPSVTITGANTNPASATTSIALTSGSTGAKIAMMAWIPAGSSAKPADILKQESSRRYQVQTADGKGAVRLVAAAPAAGQATITATDANGNTYYVVKLTGRRAYLVQNTQNGSNAWLYANDTESADVLNPGTPAKWTIGGSATAPSATDIGTVVITSN
jgi:hypothetical protein